ncbi:hypothetical protein ZWY2020_011663 [Hordeum vulgare]|nr:hypothetical protein ZWY2020_011663 [Hordeum vulgare]
MGTGCEKHDLLSRFMASELGLGEEPHRCGPPRRGDQLPARRPETTSSALTWFFWLLSSRPDVVRRIRDEVAAVRARRPGRGAGFDLDELREMHYVHAAITESMRLYPPVPVNSVQARAADVLPDGTAVGAGWFVSYNAYAMCRMESLWGEDARAYRPERWLDPAEGRDGLHQMKSVVACVVEELELAVDGEYTPRQVASLTLRMADGLPVRVKPSPTYVEGN